LGYKRRAVQKRMVVGGVVEKVMKGNIGLWKNTGVSGWIFSDENQMVIVKNMEERRRKL
jgi:hypothetical protein